MFGKKRNRFKNAVRSIFGELLKKEGYLEINEKNKYGLKVWKSDPYLIAFKKENLICQFGLDFRDKAFGIVVYDYPSFESAVAEGKGGEINKYTTNHQLVEDMKDKEKYENFEKFGYEEVMKKNLDLIKDNLWILRNPIS